MDNLIGAAPSTSANVPRDQTHRGLEPRYKIENHTPMEQDRGPYGLRQQIGHACTKPKPCGEPNKQSVKEDRAIRRPRHGLKRMPKHKSGPADEQPTQSENGPDAFIFSRINQPSKSKLLEQRRHKEQISCRDDWVKELSLLELNRVNVAT